jgi:hypothetical protein
MISPCGGGLEYLHYILRIVEGDEKGTNSWGYDWTCLSLRDINTVTWSSRLGAGRKAADIAL